MKSGYVVVDDEKEEEGAFTIQLPCQAVKVNPDKDSLKEMFLGMTVKEYSRNLMAIRRRPEEKIAPSVIGCLQDGSLSPEFILFCFCAHVAAIMSEISEGDFLGRLTPELVQKLREDPDAPPGMSQFLSMLGY